MARIPKILHYCFGFAADFGGKRWSLIHYVCLRSAIAKIVPDEIRFYYQYEPSGPWWDLTKPLVTLVPIVAPTEVFGRPLLHPAHQADVVRLERLIADGGIYLDADVLVHQCFDDLLDHDVVMGTENVGSSAGLANAVILAKPASAFLTRWYETYRSFRGKGREEFWNEHSVKIPAALAANHSEEISILPYTAFYWPLWTNDHVKWLFDSSDEIPQEGCYANHLWESNAWTYVSDLTPGDVRKKLTNFHKWARPYLADLPDDYGASPIPKRIRRQLKVKARTARAFLRNLLSTDEPSYENRRGAFEDIYRRGLWGGLGGHADFFSGVGSRGPVVEEHARKIAAILKKIQEEKGGELTVVDIGCGDFKVGRAILDLVPGCRYIGCDIVLSLIAHNQAKYSNERVTFNGLDIVTDRAPAGDVCLVRQVFQHLPNEDIVRALKNLRGFAALYVTEGQPVQRIGLVNPDKKVGADVRFDWRRGIGRGIELSEPPFSLRTEEAFRLSVKPFEETVTERVWIT
jgi:hypothetical protein